MRDSLIFYRSFWESLKALQSEDRIAIEDAIFEYSLNFTEPTNLTQFQQAIFCLIKPQLEANNKRYYNGKQHKKKRNISKTEAKQKQTGSKSEANDNENVNVNDNVNEECIMKNEEDIYTTYGELKNVKLKQEEYTKLINNVYLTEDRLLRAIEILSCFENSNPKKFKGYKSHYYVLKKDNWVYNRLLETETNEQRNKKQNGGW